MTPATYQPFKEAALGYEAIRNFVKENCTADKPMTLVEIARQLENHEHVKGIQQVRDAIKKYRTNNDFAAMREGQNLMVWWRGDGPIKAKNKSAPTEVVLNKTEPVRDTDLPEVTITKKAIHILAGGVKITIER